jgi:hypothetical protein
MSTGLARAWVRTNVESAKKLLSDPVMNLTEDEKKYLDDIVERGEDFLRVTAEYERTAWYQAKRLSNGSSETQNCT